MTRALALFVIAWLASLASAQTTQPTQPTQPTMSAVLGFDGVFKPDSWAPIYVRVSDASPRPATIEIRAARGRLGQNIEARVHTAARETTYTLYAPLGQLDRASLQLRDRDGRLMRWLDLSDQVQRTPAALGGPAFGVAGPRAAAQRVVHQLVRDTAEYVAAGAVEPALLPERAIGYGCLDVLVLPELDTDLLEDRVESAIIEWTRGGGIVIAWPAALAPTQPSPLRDLLPAEGPRATRLKLGLGQFVMHDSDPTVGATSAEDRLRVWRELTEGQISLSADDRREGVFDPLIAQAIAEEQLEAEGPATAWRPWLLAALLLGVVMGPGEIAMLLSARRHPRTWYTLAGLLLTCSSAVGLALYEPGSIAGRRIELTVETPQGSALSVALANHLDERASAIWLTGDRADPTRQPAGELNLGQRGDGFEPTAPAVLLSHPAPSVREKSLGAGTAVAIGGDEAWVINRSDAAWDAVAVVGPDSVRIGAGGVEPGGAAEIQEQAIASDAVDTRRVETGIERLAGTKGWEPLLMDRALAERLVRLQETERAMMIVARSRGGQKYLIHVRRP